MRMWSQFPILIWTLISSLVPLAMNHSQIVKFLRLVKNLASTSLWTYYLCLNSMMKQKYNVKLQDSLASPCWSKATTPTSRTRPRHHLWWVCILACEAGYFHLCLLQGASPDGVPRPPPGDGGQEQWRLQEHPLQMQAAQWSACDCFPCTHSGRIWGPCLGEYLAKVNSDLNKFTGRVWWTRTQGPLLKNQVMGKNMLGKVSHDDATRLKLANPKDYTYHSYSRISATTDANGGMTSEQMHWFYGWNSASMCQEYIPPVGLLLCTHRRLWAVLTLASRRLRLERRVSLIFAISWWMRIQKCTRQPKFLFLALLLCWIQWTFNKLTIESALSSVSGLQGSNVTVKDCVITNNHGSVNI